MKIGYARVSTSGQNLDAQIDALRQSGCSQIFQEKVSGAKKDRPELQAMLAALRPGDTVIIYKLDRLARSFRHLVDTVNIIQDKGANIQSLSDAMIDTTTAQGKLIFNIFASLAEFERDLIAERTRAGLKAARARGRVGGRPKGLSAEAERKARLAKSLYESGTVVSEICSDLSISRPTLYKYLRHLGVTIGSRANPV